MASMSTYQLVALLSDLGFSPGEIASTLYPDERNRKKAVTRVLYHLWYLRFKAKNYAKKNTVNSKDNHYPKNNGDSLEVAFDSKLYPELPHNAPFSDGTLNIKQRKLYANDFERQRAEYEQLLYFFYNSVFRRYDDDAKSIWQSIKITFLETFREFYSRFHAKYFHSKSRKYVKALTAAYVYYVFLFGLRNYYEYSIARRHFVKRLLGMVKNRNEFEKAKKEVITIFAKY